MDIVERTTDGIHILALSGRFDAYQVPALVKWLDEHPSAKQVIVNLSGVGFIDSSGLATLVKGLKLCRQNNGDLYLSNLQQAVLIIFELTRLDKAFTLFGDEADALNTFKGL
jgi:anti-sigma B factor antagonist